MNKPNLSLIPDNAVVLLGKTGMMNELVDEIMDLILPEFSYKFHTILVQRKMLSRNDGHAEWFKAGFPAQIIQSGESWKKGQIRLRVVAEFVPDEEVENESEKPIEPSLDEFREC
jgi:hypothetical protein